MGGEDRGRIGGSWGRIWESAAAGRLARRAVSRCFHGCDVVAPKQGLVPSVARSESSLVSLTSPYACCD